MGLQEVGALVARDLVTLLYACSLSADPLERTHCGDAVKFWYV